MQIPFIGGAYLDRSTNLNAQVCQNLYPVIDQQGGKSVLALYGVPGLIGYLSLRSGGGGVIAVYEKNPTAVLKHLFVSNLHAIKGPGTLTCTYHNVDVGSDGFVTAAMLGDSPVCIPFFYQNTASLNITQMEYSPFPISMGGYTLTELTSRTPCVIRVGDYTAVAFNAMNSNGTNGIYCEVYRNNVMTKTCLDFGNDYLTNESPVWLEGFSDGTLVATYLTDSNKTLKVKRSTDYGETWTNITIETQSTFSYSRPVLFKNHGVTGDDNIYIGSSILKYLGRSDVFFFVSTDKGATWTKKTNPATNVTDFGTMFGCASATTVYLARGLYGASDSGVTIYYSTDFGGSWSTNTQATFRSLSALACDDDYLFIVTKLTTDVFAEHRFHLRKSTDNGATFINMLDPIVDTTAPYPNSHSLRNYGGKFTYVYGGLNIANSLIYYYTENDWVDWEQNDLERKKTWGDNFTLRARCRMSGKLTEVHYPYVPPGP